MRRIVMGHRTTGEPVVLSDADVPPVTVAMLPGAEIHRMWELDARPTVPVTDLDGGSAHTFFPPAHGLRFGFLTIPPGLDYVPPAGTPSDALAAAAEEAERKLPGMAATFDPTRPGTHTTDTVDYIVALAGEGLMTAGDDVRIRMRAGDCLIQNGTPHAWFNEGSVPFVVAFALVAADAPLR
ncbi:cupin domain-containing protein [Pseudonocardia endophytica]|uniref:Cupin domain n=1 Tax=Pseudonocardia endophytica TaxID=401976 RepID=A0A4R1HGG7_PSEEN|nr:cupin domain-containing protein [Pseudonocardia endophytica]TCK19951.1 cupin domain [Pseudonocardia endophytica]